MDRKIKTELNSFMRGLAKQNPGEREFHQAVREVAESLLPFISDHPEYQRAQIFERMTEPDRIVIFRVTWEDDNGGIHVNRAWRVQFNNSIGPYKGGLRFHATVNQSVLKFLGFEQVFKNALTGLPMGGAKGGSNFDPKGKSDSEVMRFCHSMMIELHRHIGEDTDVPAGDIGVGAREIGYLFGQYKRLENRWAGILTGKGLTYGGSLGRTEATGYGCVYFMQNMLATRNETVANKTCLVSGSGNVALYAIEKLVELGAKVVTASDSGGFIHDPDGFDSEKIAWLKDLKEIRRGRIAKYAEVYPRSTYHADLRPWGVPADLVFPCATQNEIDADAAATLVRNGVVGVAEGANMPSNYDAVAVFLEAKTLFGPGKAANAGGVAVSGLEQSQNAQRINWTRDRVDEELRDIMGRIHAKCVEHGKEGTWVNYVRGANIGGFIKVADAMLSHGVV